MLAKSARTQIDRALDDPRVRAFLDMIARFESAGRYDVIYGGGTFSDYSKHPAVRVPFFNPATGRQDYSTAAGRYQINKPTYDWIAPIVGVSDFSPNSQDRLAVALLLARGALEDVIAGRFDEALATASGTWASLPGSKSGQRQALYSVARAEYLKNGGTIA